MELTKQDFDGIRAVIQKLAGLAIPDDKLYLVKQRLGSLLGSLSCRSFTELHQRLALDSDTSLREALIAAITTNETYFFRDEHPFAAFAEAILPAMGRALISKRRQHPAPGVFPRIRIWSTACSTGQEPYSIAMLIHEYILANRHQGISEEDFEIIASDISSPVLNRARAGEYSEFEINRGLSPARKKTYFLKQGKLWKLREWLCDRVEFRRINLIEPFSYPNRLDMIFCRNTLIYFDHETKRRIVKQFHASLVEAGLLLIGATESLYNISDLFAAAQIGQSQFHAKKSGAHL